MMSFASNLSLEYIEIARRKICSLKSKVLIKKNLSKRYFLANDLLFFPTSMTFSVLEIYFRHLQAPVRFNG